ncbi:hypothetical protein BC936DRAFT_137900 [Jimgerdemannia flammicorona]|uniref:Uncharacterized protein n=1 Tax=Jimgerdemannia flammicorona TaxID=994334 RepID=A0A433DIU1_9FUNG|nr:hypothetical protein BC936DRAFT_137900 [Jimgerdemannia flammicorona]
MNNGIYYSIPHTDHQRRSSFHRRDYRAFNNFRQSSRTAVVEDGSTDSALELPNGLSFDEDERADN